MPRLDLSVTARDSEFAASGTDRYGRPISTPGNTQVETRFGMLPASASIRRGCRSSKPPRMWGGRGVGADLQPVRQTYPRHRAGDGARVRGLGVRSNVVRFHLQCQSVWDEARQLRRSPWTLVSNELPPLLHIVEARIGLHEQRALILTVMRINHGDTGPLVWLNATTNSPLPEQLAADRMAADGGPAARVADGDALLGAAHLAARLTRRSALSEPSYVE